MEVVLYFEEPHNLMSGLCAVEKVSKKIGRISVTLAARDKFEFNAAGKNFSTCTLDELNASDFDCLIMCDTENFTDKIPSEKIFG